MRRKGRFSLVGEEGMFEQDREKGGSLASKGRKRKGRNGPFFKKEAHKRGGLLCWRGKKKEALSVVSKGQKLRKGGRVKPLP